MGDGKWDVGCAIVVLSVLLITDNRLPIPHTPFPTSQITHRRCAKGFGSHMSTNYLKAVFWDYPDLSDPKAVELKLKEARSKNDRKTLEWIIRIFQIRISKYE
jgi:hypothetical protein